MNVEFSTLQNPHQAANEDYVAASSDAAILLDGSGVPSDVETGCSHDLPWFVRQLGVRLLEYASDLGISLTQALREAIRVTALAHEGTCNPLHPLSPSAAVVVVRSDGEVMDWLVLSDSTLLIHTSEGVQAHTDQRLKQQAAPQRAALRKSSGTDNRELWAELVAEERRLRNKSSGYWVASGDPFAAEHALVGSIPQGAVSGAILLSDGAARPVSPFNLETWELCSDWVSSRGTSSWLAHVRAIENMDDDRTKWPRSKKHDDATAALVTWS